VETYFSLVIDELYTNTNAEVIIFALALFYSKRPQRSASLAYDIPIITSKEASALSKLYLEIFLIFTLKFRGSFFACKSCIIHRVSITL